MAAAAVVTAAGAAADGAAPARAAASVNAAAASPGADFAACEAGVRAQPDVYEPYACFYAAARTGGRWEEAEERLVRLGEELPFDGWTTLLRGHLWLLRDEPRAVELYRQAAEAFRGHGVARGEILARHNLRNILQRRGEAVAAGVEVERVLVVARQSGEPALLAQALVIDATHRVDNGGDLARAHRDLRRATRLLPADAPYGQQKPGLIALAGVSYQLGSFDEAVDSYRRLLRLARQQHDAVEEAAILFNIANTRQRQLEEQPTTDAIATLEPLAREALDTARRAGNPLVEVRAAALLAQLEAARGDRGGAKRRLEEALALARQLGHPERTMICLWLLADLAAADDPAEARRRSDEAAALALATGNDRQLAYAWQSRMRVDWAGRPPAEAMATSTRALDAIETLAAAQPEETSNVGLFGAWTRDYRWLAGRLLDREGADLDAAFGVMERMRARALLQSLAAAPAPARAAGTVASGEQQALRALIDAQRRLLDPAVPAAERQGVLAALEERELDLAEARAAARAVESGAPASPEEGRQAPLLRPQIGHRDTATPGERRGDAGIATLTAVRAALRPGEALLLYQLAPWRDLYGRFAGGSWVLAVSAGGATLHRLPDRSEIEPLVPVFLGLVQRRDGSEAAAARRLFATLMAAPLAALPTSTERLVIVPDGALFSLPFDVLQPAAAGAPPVGARYELAVVPSATALLHWRNAVPAPAAHGALVLADPALPGGAAAATARDGSLGDAVALGALPAARREGRALLRLLGPTTELLEGADATERALARADLGSFAVLHLAAHAIADGVHPQRSAVLLAAADAREDGLLQGREIARLPLAGRTVFLSACRTAAGSVAAGEGPLSLARAFQQAGARAVVGSRWPLRDDEAAVLVAEVYRHLAAGRSLGAALLAARRDAWERGRPAASWAALVLMGEPDVEVLAGLPLPRPWSNGRALLAALLLMLLAVAALAGWTYRRRARRWLTSASSRR